MSPSLSWIDDQRWARLLERAGLDTNNGTAQRAHHPLPIPRGQHDEGRDSVPGPVTAVRQTLPSSSLPPLTGRLQELVTWAQTTTAASRVFISDDNGLPLIGRKEDHGLMAAAAVLQRALASLHPMWTRSSAEHLAVQLDDGERLQLIAARNRWGRFTLGLTTADALDASRLADLRRALERTFEEKGQAAHG